MIYLAAHRAILLGRSNGPRPVTKWVILPEILEASQPSVGKLCALVNSWDFSSPTVTSILSTQLLHCHKHFSIDGIRFSQAITSHGCSLQFCRGLQLHCKSLALSPLIPFSFASVYVYMLFAPESNCNLGAFLLLNIIWLEILIIEYNMA